MMEAMATVHMSEAEVARDLHAVLAKVQQGVEVVREKRPVSQLLASLSAEHAETEFLLSSISVLELEQSGTRRFILTMPSGLAMSANSR